MITSNGSATLTPNAPVAVEYATQESILTALAAGKIDASKAGALLSKLNPPKPANRLYAKVSEKGAISVYGLQRMPVTLYVGQWERLLAFADELKTFAEKNNPVLSRKPV